MSILDKIKVLSETLIKIEEKLGILKLIQYGIFVIIMYAVFNFSSIVENILKIRAEEEKREHAEKMLLRDQLMTDLNPLLVELRSKTGASRVLYFEYHNSTENFIGIPFKYANLVISNQEYECPGFDLSRYRDINSGMISGIYDELKQNEIIINTGFREEPKETFEFFEAQDGSKQQIYINLPGIDSPMGMIILEWVDMENRDWDKIQKVIHPEITRINALISKYTP